MVEYPSQHVLDELVNRLFRAADQLRSRALEKGADLDWDDEEDERVMTEAQRAFGELDAYTYCRQIPEWATEKNNGLGDDNAESGSAG